ncbi:hypothetical protein [Motilibacter aurantiacus]|uniref:hypothetical protein n=1 Tax=Motilibacter aurantiacus TaxID=2714955 RepID=UPI00140963C9|nr:hypothetical protein [Motilibacter aurantiacus]NHC46396.1 hypothetical protein [Motilibacter aurantiacus]
MSTPDERPPADPLSESLLDLGPQPSAEHDPEVAEDYAESVGVDPTPDEVEHYKELVGDPTAEPA